MLYSPGSWRHKYSKAEAGFISDCFCETHFWRLWFNHEIMRKRRNMRSVMLPNRSCSLSDTMWNGEGGSSLWCWTYFWSPSPEFDQIQQVLHCLLSAVETQLASQPNLLKKIMDHIVSSLFMQTTPLHLNFSGNGKGASALKPIAGDSPRGSV